MKTRIMFYLVLVALFLFVGNSFAVTETEEPMDVSEEHSEIESPREYNEIISPQGTETDHRTFYGLLAGFNTMSNGRNNSFFGTYAGFSNESGDNNSFFGRSAGYSNTASYNSFFGFGAGYKNTTGNLNSFFGVNTGHENTTGMDNSFFGSSAGWSNTASYNSFFGSSAGYKNTTGRYNSFFGRGAGYYNTTGGNNSFFGMDAGYENQTGSHNVFLGAWAGYYEKGSNKLYIDSSSTATPLIWGDFHTNEVKIHGGFKAIASYMSSDQRWKKNIQPLESSLYKISNLQGVSYEWNREEYPDVGMTEGKQIGFVAQDVEQILPELVSEDEDGYKAVSYTKLTAVLVEAVKELKTENRRQKELLQQQLQKQQAEIEELRSMIKELKS